MCLEAVFFWPVFLCLFWAMFLCPVRACFLAYAPSGFFWEFFCASFFDGNKCCWGVSPPPPPPRCFASQGRGLASPGQTAGPSNPSRLPTSNPTGEAAPPSHAVTSANPLPSPPLWAARGLRNNTTDGPPVL
jgi:hypothetical protein